MVYPRMDTKDTFLFHEGSQTGMKGHDKQFYSTTKIRDGPRRVSISWSTKGRERVQKTPFSDPRKGTKNTFVWGLT